MCIFIMFWLVYEWSIWSTCNVCVDNLRNTTLHSTDITYLLFFICHFFPQFDTLIKIWIECQIKKGNMIKWQFPNKQLTTQQKMF